MLQKHPDVTVVAEAENGVQLLELAAAHQPDVVITDIQMPVMNGVEACKALQDTLPAIGVIALSTYDTDQLVTDMLDAGAQGYLLKNADREEIVEAVKTVYRGGTYYCKHISLNLEQLLYRNRINANKNKQKCTFSRRELDIIHLTCKQFTNKEIAGILDLSLRTIESHKERMLQRVESKNFLGVILYALRENLVQIEN